MTAVLTINIVDLFIFYEIRINNLIIYRVNKI